MSSDPDATVLPFVEIEHVRTGVDDGTYHRGLAYFEDGAVQSVEWDAPRHTLTGLVDGSGGRRYRCSILIDVTRTSQPIMRAQCTCPVHEHCKHTVATILAGNARARAIAPRTAESAAWRAILGVASPATPRVDAAPTALALGVELRQKLKRGRSSWSPTRVETATARSLAGDGVDVLVGLRPLEKSARSDTWIKGEVSWDAVRRPGHRYDQAQARWFAELFSIGRDMRTFGTFSDVSEWLTLDDIASTLLWPHLRAAAAVGVPFVPLKKHHSVRLAGTATARLHVARDGDDVLLSPIVAIDGGDVDARSVRAIGGVGLYSIAVTRERIELTLAPADVAEPVRALLQARDGVRVPPDDVAELTRLHLPTLARRGVLDAPGFDVPEPVRPTLVVAVRFAKDHRIAVVVSWRYEGAPDAPLASPPTLDRDREVEADIRTRVEALWHDATDVPFAPDATARGLQAAQFAAQLLPLLEADPDVVVEITGERPAYRELSGDPRIEITSVESQDPDWFDLGVVVSIDGRMIPFGMLFAALSRGKTKLLLSDGAYFSLQHPSLDRLRELLEEAGALDEWETGARISRHQTSLWADFEDVADESVVAVSWRATADALRHVDGVPRSPLPEGLHAELRPYQRTGFDWLAFLWEHRLGGILADDMGLGKTLQMLALITRTRAAGEPRPVLVVAPTSVLATWRDEAARFAPGLRVEVVGATRAKRGTSVEEAARDADVVVTSYTLLRLDEDEFTGTDWSIVVLDEAQFVKNSKTRAYRVVQQLRSDVVYAITGTPLENSLTELWALLSLTAPGLFASARRFRDEYVQPIEKGAVPENAEGGEHRARRLARLRRRIRPLVLRRTKESVAQDLPPKQEQEIRVELGPAHRALYDTTLQRERQKVLGLLDDLDRNRFIVFRSLTLLRMLSLAPSLVDPAHASIVPSKLTALFEQLDEVVAEGHRALVFSQFTSFLGLVADQLEERGIPYAYLDGSTRDREAAIAGFRSGDDPVFLISLKAGGFGLTLTEADYVFLLDPWWNPAAESQAIDRAHRIGQERTVMVYRLIANGTIEEKVMALQRRKARLFHSVMDDDALFGQALTASDIRGLFDD